MHMVETKRCQSHTFSIRLCCCGFLSVCCISGITSAVVGFVDAEVLLVAVWVDVMVGVEVGLQRHLSFLITNVRSSCKESLLLRR